MIVHLTLAAETDLRRIAVHIAESSPERALSFVRELRESCMALGHFPRACPVVGRYERQNIRRKVHGNYLIFFAIKEDGVEILHVLHGAMEFEAVLFP